MDETRYTLEVTDLELREMLRLIREAGHELEGLGSEDSAGWWRDLALSLQEQAADQEVFG